MSSMLRSLQKYGFCLGELQFMPQASWLIHLCGARTWCGFICDHMRPMFSLLPHRRVVHVGRSIFVLDGNIIISLN